MPLPTTELVDAGVAGDAKYPGTKRTLLVESVEGSEYLDERVLRRVMGLIAVAKKVKGESIDRTRPSLGDLSTGSFVTRPRRANQVGVGVGSSMDA